MSQPPFLTTLYGLLLRLYPRPFRQEFAAEMQQVFVALLTETAQQREQSLLRLCLHEFGGLLIGIGKEWLLMLSQKMQYFSHPQFTRPVTPAPWAEVLLTIVPVLVLLIFDGYITLSQLLHSGYPGVFGTVQNVLLLGWVVFVALRVVVRQRFDPAALLLLGYGPALAVVLGANTLTALIAARHTPPPIVFFGALGIVALLTVIGIGGLVARQHGAHALLVVLPVAYLVNIWLPFTAAGTLVGFGWFVLTPLMLLRAHTIGWQVIAGSVLLMIWGAMGYIASFLLPPAMHTSLLLDVMAIVIFLTTGGILALAGWYYAWLAASSSPKPRSSANSRRQQ
jgi:hypothetical protein